MTEGAPDAPLLARVLEACEELEEIAHSARVRIEQATMASDSRLRVAAEGGPRYLLECESDGLPLRGRTQRRA
jgi:hypothetical protein